MYKVFNIGHRMEIYIDKEHAQSIIDIAQSFHIDAKIIGHVEDSEEKQVTIESPYGTFIYK